MRTTLLVGLIAISAPLGAQRYQLRDGTVLAASEVRLEGARLFRRMRSGLPGATAEQAIPAGEVVRLDWPEPPDLALLRQGIGGVPEPDTLERLDAIRTEFVLFARVPGSWWPEAARLRLRYLLQRDDREAAIESARELIATSNDPEAVGEARIALATLEARAGHPGIARAMLDEIMREPVPAEVGARAAILGGDIALAEGDAETALECYLRIPVFHPGRTALLGPALLGSVRAYLELGESKRAERAVLEMEALDPLPAQAGEARSLLEAAR